MSQFYDQASLVMVPSGYKAGKVYSQKPLTTDGQLTFTRTGDTATRVNADGLVEKVRTNLLLQSNQFDTTWLNDDSTETGGQSGYDGTSNAWLLTKTAGGGRIGQVISVSGLATFSVYAKAGTDNFVRLGSSDGNIYAYFNLASGNIGTTGSGATTTITSAGNGWYRCSMSGNSSFGYFNIWVADGDNDISGTSGNIYLQNAQLETGDIATDYIPTTTSAVSVGPVANLPRIDYTGGTNAGVSACGKLLLEPQTTALLQYSEQLDNGYWGKSGTSMLANQTTSPDGYVNADKSTISSGVAYHDSLIKTYSSTAGQAYTTSIFAKKGVGIEAIYFYQGDGSRVAKFNLTTGEYIGHAPTNGYNAYSSYGSQDFGNGWFRFWVTYTAATSSGNYTVGISMDTTNTVVPINGNGSDYLYLWGANLTQTSYLQSYVPTLSAAVTRGADAAYKTGISSLIGQTEGTLFVEADLSSVIDPSNIRGLIELNDGTANNRISIYRGANDLTLSAAIFYGGAANAFITASNVSGNVKLALAYNSAGATMYLNGSLVNTDNSVTIPACSDLDLGIITNNTSRILGDGIKQALLFKTRLTNAQLAELTTL